MGPFVVLDQATVWANGALVPSSYLDNLGAHISGGKALLHRYSVTAEKALLGAYDLTQDTVYDYPNRTAGSIIDLTYNQLYLANADIETFQHYVGVGSVVAPVTNYSNRLRSASAVFKANGLSYPRDSGFGGRDVKIGDKVQYSATVSSVLYSITTHVAGFVAEVVAAVVGTATAATGNQATQSLNETFSQTAGGNNYITGTGSAASYSDYNAINRTYTLVCTLGGAPGVALLNVTSSDGLDNAVGITPAAFSSPTSIGTHGATVTFTTDSMRSVDAGLPNSLFVVGQTWQQAVSEAFTKPTLTAGGTYTGTTDKTLIVTVTTGGPFSSSTTPLVSVTTTLGTGYIAPFLVQTSGVAVSIGDGVTLAFTGSGLVGGDIYYVPVTAATAGAYQTLILNDNITGSLATVSDGNLTISIPVATLLVNPERPEAAPALNWLSDVSTITLKGGMTSTAPDGSLVDTTGAAMYKPVIDGTAYIQYREWDQSTLEQVLTISDPTDLTAVLGANIPDNPLCYGVGKALANANGRPVYYTPVSDPLDYDAWDDLLASIQSADGVYKLVPLTYDPVIIEKFITHCEAQSTPEVEAWRSTLAAIQILSSIPVVTPASTTDGGDALCTVIDNPSISGTQYTLVQCNAGNGQFVTNGVASGDIFRFIYVSDGFGNETYTEFVVDHVVNQDELVLETGPAVTYATPQKGQIYRNLDKPGIQAHLQASVVPLASNRCSIVLPDQLVDTIGGVATSVPSYYAAAALAGALSAVAPHQPYSFTEFTGFIGVPDTTSFFGPGQLAALEASGFTILDLNTDGVPFVRKFVNTDTSSVTNAQEVMTRNTDAIQFVLLQKLSKFRGHANITTAVEQQVQFEATMAIVAIQQESSQTPLLGPMIISGTISDVRVHLTLLDTLVIDGTIVVPYPLNEFQLTVVI